jgi:hypothetical protein
MTGSTSAGRRRNTTLAIDKDDMTVVLISSVPPVVPLPSQRDMIAMLAPARLFNVAPLQF